MPIARRSAIHPTVIVVSARKRAAKNTVTESPLVRVLRSASCNRPRFNSSAMMSSASAVMLRPHPLAHLHQQLLPKLLLAQTPAAPNRLELLAFLRTAPLLYISISRTDPIPFPTAIEVLRESPVGQFQS